MHLPARTLLRRAAAAALVLQAATVLSQTPPRPLFIPYADVSPIVDALRPDLLPTDLRDLAPEERQARWPGWIARRDADIRARLAEGDDDSVVNFLFYGTSFTARRRPTDADVAALVDRPADALIWLRPRIDDLLAALALPAPNERLSFVGEVLRRHGADPRAPAGTADARRYLEAQALATAARGATRTRALLDTTQTALSERLTLFRERGLSSDTSIFIDFGIDAALEGIRRAGALTTRSVKRVAIIGPGLDFSDKLDGYDFYPPQTIQPFALIDALTRLDLLAPDLRVTTFDIGPRILGHLEAARNRASQGRPYSLVLPRNLDQAWDPALVAYWRRVGERIGTAGSATAPRSAGRVEVRRVQVKASAVLALTPQDLDIVAQRLDPLPPAERFDLVIATNILLYYDVFEQSLAAANIAAMLRPGGLFLTNNRIFELPGIPLGGIDYTDVSYMTLPGIGSTGDRVIWYQRR